MDFVRRVDAHTCIDSSTYIYLDILSDVLYTLITNGVIAQIQLFQHLRWM